MWTVSQKALTEAADVSFLFSRSATWACSGEVFQVFQGGSRGDLKEQEPVQWRGVSILHEKWCKASWASMKKEMKQSIVYVDVRVKYNNDNNKIRLFGKLNMNSINSTAHSGAASDRLEFNNRMSRFEAMYQKHYHWPSIICTSLSLLFQILISRF